MLDKDFYSASQKSFRKYLYEKGFKKRFIEEIGQMATLVNYDQSVDSINAFPGTCLKKNLLKFCIYLSFDK